MIIGQFHNIAYLLWRSCLVALLFALMPMASLLGNVPQDSIAQEDAELISILTGERSSSSDSLETRYDSSDVAVRLLSAEKIEAYAADPDFQYERDPQDVRALSIFDRLWIWFIDKISTFIFSDTYSPLRKLFIWLFILTIAGYMVWLMSDSYFQAFFAKGQNTELIFDDSIEDIHEMNFDILIQEAVSKKNFRRATRLHYLKLLKEMTDRGQLAWRPEKTNQDYLHELKDDGLKTAFSNLTRYFEYIWYGNFPVSADAFKQVSESFRNFSNKLKQKI